MAEEFVGDGGAPERKVYPPITKPDGVVCPRCGCRHLPVETTRRTSNRTIRYRHCRNCGRRVITFEAVRDDSDLG